MRKLSGIRLRVIPSGRKHATRALRENEGEDQRQLKISQDPDNDAGQLNLEDLINSETLQSLVEDVYHITGIAIGILDVSGKVLVAAGWQDICTKFHRCHPDTLRHCTESDTLLSFGVSEGAFKAYKCKNNMWDTVTPITVGGRHLGNIYLGQFFYKDEIPDVEVFRAQARQYGFDEAEYLAALGRVPRLDRETVDIVLRFYGKLAKMISTMSYSTMQLSRSLVARRRAEEGLRVGEENLRTLFNSLNDAVIIHDYHGRVLEANDAMLTMFGVTDRNYRDFSIEEYTAPVDSSSPMADRLKGQWDRLTKEKHPVFELRARSPLQPCMEFDAEVSLQAGRWYNQDVVVAMVRDISERKRLEAMLFQSQKLEALGQLAGGVAHDTNNMLGVIIGYADLLIDSVSGEPQLRNDLEQIRKAASHSALLTRQLLAFARKQVVQPVVSDLDTLVEGTQQMLRRLIGERNTLVWKPATVHWDVWIDPSQMDQVLTNLVINARDALSPGGSIVLETSNLQVDEVYAQSHPDATPGDYVVLAITDTGCGMSQAVQARIFEPFFSTKGLGRGTGLGLAMVYGIVRQNNGFINVYSTEGVGTTFRIHLPRYLGEGSAPGAVPDSEVLGGHETILLVEDEEALLELGRRLLQAAGYRVLATSHPMDALRMVQENEISLLATDLVMPTLNGRELFEQIHALRPSVCALFLSGYPAGTISLEFLPERGTGFLQKPFTRIGLLRKVREVLDH